MRERACRQILPIFKYGQYRVNVAFTLWNGAAVDILFLTLQLVSRATSAGRIKHPLLVSSPDWITEWNSVAFIIQEVRLEDNGGPAAYEI